MFTEQQLHVIRFCAEECRRQQSGETSVANMIGAYDWMEGISPSGRNIKRITVGHIVELGRLVEPEKNLYGFRSVPAFIRDKKLTDPEFIENGIRNILNAFYDHRLDVDEFFYEYQLIHPFADGNGRTGVILYNYLHGSLNNPVWPPDFFGGK